MIVNVWRPIQETPVLNWSMCALDGSTLQQGDVHPTTLVEFNNAPGGSLDRTKGEVTKSNVVDVDGKEVPFRIGESTTPLHDPNHRWIFFPQMSRDEAMLFKVHDSRRDGRVRFGCHCACKYSRFLCSFLCGCIKTPNRNCCRLQLRTLWASRQLIERALRPACSSSCPEAWMQRPGSRSPITKPRCDHEVCLFYVR